MLGNKDAVANVAVKDLDIATEFYRDTLGLKPMQHEGEELVVFQSGHSSINVYRSEYAGTNKATAVTWTVDSVEDEVKALRNKGVVFEHYDMPGMTREGDVHVGDHMKVAWFKTYGVRECWLVDPVARTVDVLNLTAPDTPSRSFERDQVVRSTVLPRLRLRVDAVLAL